MCGVDESPLQVYHLTGTPFRPLSRHIKHKVQDSRFYNPMGGVDEPPLQVYHLTRTYFHPLSQNTKHKKNVNFENHVFISSYVVWMKVLYKSTI